MGSRKAPIKRSKGAPTKKARAPRPTFEIPAPVTPRPRVLEPGTPEYVRRGELLAIMNDETRPEDERRQAAMDALPLCYLEADPIVIVRHIKD